MRESIRRYVWFFCIAAVLCSVTPLIAQIDRGTIEGLVKDPSGAVIPGATIVLEKVDTGVKREDQSDPAGRYSFVQVQPGTYRVTARAAGFADLILNNVQLLVNTPLTLPITFEKVGAVSETVSVSAESVQVNTTDASIGNAIGNKAIVQFPLNARNIGEARAHRRVGCKSSCPYRPPLTRAWYPLFRYNSG